MNFEHFIDKILAVEKGYVNDPADSGGETNFGITVAVARANGYTGAMADMPESFAREVYRKRYIVKPGFDRIALVHEGVAQELIDTGVNMGPVVAATFFQRWLNAFNDQGSHYADLFVDGSCGEVTTGALRAFLRKRGEEGARVMVRALNCLQGARYLDISETTPKNERFLWGWMRTRVMEE